ncbi:hypothetical protein BC940DRAFT_287193 [Gongronella butleri]|nr:hypothetical protein BC940DRAFT_287193 [Gongronella butleri]
MDANTPASIQARQAYLSFWLHMNELKPKVTVHMAETTTVQGVYSGTDSEQHRFRIDALSVPMGVIEHAVVRGGDTDMLEFHLQDAK